MAAGGTGDHRVGLHSQAKNQQGDTGEGGVLQAGAEEHLSTGYTTGKWRSDWR